MKWLNKTIAKTSTFTVFCTKRYTHYENYKPCNAYTWINIDLLCSKVLTREQIKKDIEKEKNTFSADLVTFLFSHVFVYDDRFPIFCFIIISDYLFTCLVPGERE